MRYKHIQANLAEKYQIEGGEVTSILASAQDTDNRVSIFDSRLPQGNEAPWHYHEIDDEIFYVISGEIEFGVDQEQFVAKSGDLVIAGPHVPRRFKAITDSHLLIINSPSGPSEGFIRDIASLPPGHVPSDEDEKRFIEKYKIHIIKKESK